MTQPLPPLPIRIVKLPVDHRGFPVPWFVQWFKDGEPTSYGDGEPDFRVIDARKIPVAVNQNRCWVCGETMGVHKAFVIGPMCAINRIISEPPSHLDCAIFSATACPFLTRPRMRRNEKDLPEQGVPAAGLHIDRNPGVMCVWVTRSYKPFRPHAGNAGVLFALGEPERTIWYTQGREATRAEVMVAIESGYPLLQDMAEREGREAIAALAQQRDRAMPLLPAG